MTATRRHRLILILLLPIAAGLALWAALHRTPAKAATPHAIPVTVAKVVSEDLPLTVSALGSAQAWTSDTIFSQVSGRLIGVNFKEGGEVKAGQVLAEVDPRPYQAALAEAEGTLKRDEGLLAGAQRDLTRYQHLLAESAVARQVAEDQAATVAQYEGTVQFDKGQLAAARVNLEFCRITSPISGRAGVRLVDPGNLVSATGSVASTPGTAAATSTAAATGMSASATASSGGGVGTAGSSSGSGIVVINQIQPIAVTFTVPEDQFQRLLNVSQGFRQPLAVRAYSQESGQLLDSGELSVADNRVDAATGTVELKARFPNPGRQLWPGQFVNVKLVLQTLNNATVIPTAALNRGPSGQFAFVVGADHKVSARPLKLVATEDTSAIVTGVKPGETVVVDGQMNLKAGSAIRIAQAAPTGRAAQ